MPFIALPRRTESDRCDYLARTATEKSIPPPPSRFLFHKRDLPVDYSRSPTTRSFRYEALFILLFLNFLFSFYDNASTFTFYTSDVVSNFVSLSFRHEETHEAITFPLWKTKLSFSFLYNIYIAISFGMFLISHRFYLDLFRQLSFF